MKNEERREAQGILRDIGYPIPVDGVWGKWSGRALGDCLRMFSFSKKAVGVRFHAGRRLTARRLRILRAIDGWDGRCSPNFRYVEFRCKGSTRGMHAPEHNWIRVSRKLIRRLESYADRWGKPTIISGGRSVPYNRAVGGASLSQHRYSFFPPLKAFAVDIAPSVHHSKVRASGLFGGIGYNTSSGNVSHVDTRPWVATWFYNR